MSATRIRVGDKYVEFVTEDRLILTDDPEAAGLYSWAGQVRAAELVQYHLTMEAQDAKENERDDA
jgi:hypothetical protein